MARVKHTISRQQKLGKTKPAWGKRHPVPDQFVQVPKAAGQMHGLGNKTRSSVAQEAVNGLWLAWCFGTVSLQLDSVLVLFPKPPVLTPGKERVLAGSLVTPTVTAIPFLNSTYIEYFLTFTRLKSQGTDVAGIWRISTRTVYGLNFISAPNRSCASPLHEVGVESTERELVSWMGEKAGGSQKKKLVFKVRNWRMKDADVERNIHVVDLDRHYYVSWLSPISPPAPTGVISPCFCTRQT